MESNQKKLLVAFILFVGLLYIPHFAKNLVAHLISINGESLQNLMTAPNEVRLFSKIIVLQVVTVLLIFYFLYNQHVISKIRFRFQKTIAIISLALSSYAFLAAYYLSNIIINRNPEVKVLLPLIIILQFTLLSGYLFFMILAVFGKEYVKTIYHATYPQPIYLLFGSAILTALVATFQNAWPWFSYTITRILVVLFTPFFPTDYYIVNSTPTLEVANFSVSIGAPCSGIESMLLFFAFAIGIFALDHKRLKKIPYLVSAILGLAGIYFVNVIRLFFCC